MPVVLTEDIASQHIDDFNAANPSPFSASSTPGGSSDLSNPTLQAPTMPVAPDMGAAAPSSPPVAAAPTPPLTADAPVTAPLANPSPSVTPTTADAPVTAPLTTTSDGHAFSPYDNIFAKYAGAQANNPEFLAIVAAGTKAESQWDTTNTTGDGGHSWGLFQMHDGGAGAGMGGTRLDPDTASSVMVPAYVASYNAAKSRGLTGAALAAATAQGAEHSADDTGAAYSKAWNEIMGQPTYTGPQAVSGQSSPSAAPSTSQAPTGSDSTQGATTTPPSADDHIAAFNQANPSPFDQIKSAVGGAASAAGTTVQEHIDALNSTLGNPFDTVGRIANDVTSPQAAMSDLSSVIGGDSGVNQARQQFAPSVLDASSPHDARDPNTALNVVAGVDGGGSGGGKGLVDAQAAVDALRARFPQMSEGSIAASGAGKDLAAAQAAQAAPPTNGYPSYPAPLQPPTPAPAPAMDSTDIMQGLLNMLKSSGTHDAAQIDALQGQIDSLKPQPEVAPTNSVPSTAVADSSPAITFDSQGNQLSGPTEPPPLDEHANINTSPEPANPNQVVTPQGTLAPGDTNLPGKAGGSEPVTSKPPAVMISGSQELPKWEPPVDQPPPTTVGATPDNIQIAHERIDKALGSDPARVDAAHAQLDQLVQAGDPGAVSRFLNTDVEGKTAGAMSILRSDRTGSMAGGINSMNKVALSPVIQLAMRAPVAALKAIVKGKPGDIAGGLQGGISSLSDAAATALQTIRYGTTMEQALVGPASPSGANGFAPGLDVLGKSNLTRTIGTGLIGAVRLHGAVSDATSTVARGMARGSGQTAEQAALTGQSAALRSGNYGSLGKGFADALEGLKSQNPALDVLGQILLPFYRVGYNITTQGIERSPVGALGTAADLARAQLPAGAPAWLKGPYAAGADASHVTPVGDRLANNMFGVGLAGGGFALAAQGNITGAHPANGAPAWSVQVHGMWIPLRTFGPAGEALAQSADLYESARDGKGDLARTAELSAAGYASHINDETWLRGLSDIISSIGAARNIGGPRETQAQNAIGYEWNGLKNSFIPQATLATQVGKDTGLIEPPASKGAATTSRTSARPARPSARPPRPSR